MPAQNAQQQRVQDQEGNRVIRKIEVPPEPEKELSTGMWFLIGGIALFFDTTGALCNFIPPPAGQLIDDVNDALTDGVFILISAMTGVNFSKSTMGITFVLKFIPFLNILPEYTVMVIILYFQERAKKKLAKIPGGKTIMSVGSTRKMPATPPPFPSTPPPLPPTKPPRNNLVEMKPRNIDTQAARQRLQKVKDDQEDQEIYRKAA